MDEVKAQIVHKLNSILALIKQCAVEVLKKNDKMLTEEVALAALTHENICVLFEQDGGSKQVIAFVEEFGAATIKLYNLITKTNNTETFSFGVKNKDNLLN